MLTGGEFIGVCGAVGNFSCVYYSDRGLDLLGRPRVICDSHFNEQGLQHSSLCYNKEAMKDEVCDFLLEEL